eukprot:UN15045
MPISYYYPQPMPLQHDPRQRIMTSDNSVTHVFFWTITHQRLFSRNGMAHD